jgi:uncharacterized phage protein gp47/JayE
VSKRRKRVGGNPANRNRSRHTAGYEADRARREFLAYMIKIAEDNLETASNELLAAGATWEQIEAHRRAMRCKIAAEALAIDAIDVFEWAVEPLVNEVEFMNIIAKAKELGMDNPQEEEGT